MRIIEKYYSKIGEIFFKYKGYFDLPFYVAFASKFLLYFLETTALPVFALGKPYVWLFYIGEVSYIISVVLGIMINLVFESNRKIEKIFSFLLIVISFMYISFSESYTTELPEMLILMALSLGKSHKKMLRISLFEGSTVMIVFMLLSQAGVVADYIQFPARHALGMVYCTDCGAHVLFLFLLYLIYMEYKINKTTISIALLVLELLMFIINAKTASLCLIIFCIGILLINYFSKIIEKLAKILIFIFPIVFVCFLGLMGLYSKKQSLFPNSTFTSRIILSIDGFKKYGVTPWGRMIYQNGNGGEAIKLTINMLLNENYQKTIYASIILILVAGMIVLFKLDKKMIPFSLLIISSILLIIPWFTTEVIIENNMVINYSSYFFLDSSYINTLISKGFVVFIVIMLITIFMQYKAYKEKNYYFLLVMCVIALDCMLEHHLTEISYNSVFMLVFTDVYKRRN